MARDPEKHREHQHKYRAKNLEKCREACRKWGIDNPEKKRESHRQWRAKNVEKERTRSRQWRADNPEKLKALELKRSFGISLSDYGAMMKLQGDRCAICGGIDARLALAVDHDHVTGKIRGLLCGRCNKGVGHFHDDQALLKLAIEYLSNEGVR